MKITLFVFLNLHLSECRSINEVESGEPDFYVDVPENILEIEEVRNPFCIIRQRYQSSPTMIKSRKTEIQSRFKIPWRGIHWDDENLSLSLSTDGPTLHQSTAFLMTAATAFILYESMISYRTLNSFLNSILNIGPTTRLDLFLGLFLSSLCSTWWCS